MKIIKEGHFLKGKFKIKRLTKIIPKCGNYGCISTMISCIFHWLIRRTPATNPGNSNPISIKLTVMGINISEDSISIGLKSPYHRLKNRTKTCFTTRQILKNFEIYDHWQYRHIAFWIIYNFSEGMKQWCRNMGIWCYQKHFQIKLSVILIFLMKQ